VISGGQAADEAPGGCRPGRAGTTQLYRIADALLETQIVFSFAWKGIDVLPARSLTPQALVIALSPLLDDRSVGALLDLRGRGFDLVIIDISPLAFTALPRTRTHGWRCGCGGYGATRCTSASNASASPSPSGTASGRWLK
jgi:hypothetical protein